MAHELDIIGGQASFVTARQSAWHRLGTVLPENFTAEQSLAVANLGGWNVRKTALQTVVDGEVIDVPDRRAVIRTNPVTGRPESLGVVGAGFEHVQNEEQVAFLDALTDDTGAHLETAGSLRGGRQVFFTCKLPEALMVGGVDRVDLYLAVLNGHDGSMAFRALLSPIRIVCANTQAAALGRAAQAWSTRHTKNAARAVDEARRTLQLAWAYSTEFEAEAERMIQTELLDGEFEKIIGRVFGQPAEKDSAVTARHKVERLDVIRGLYHDAATQGAIRGTRWAGYQAVTEFIDWQTPVKGAGSHDARRSLRAVDGAGVKDKEAAFELLRVSV